MAETETGWKKDWPTVTGYYWRRINASDLPTLVRIIGDTCRFTDGSSEGRYECYEFLGPLAATDFEQLARLREWKESAMTLLARYDSIAETFGGRLGSSKIDNLERGVSQLRAELAQRKGEKSQ